MAATPKPDAGAKAEADPPPDPNPEVVPMTEQQQHDKAVTEAIAKQIRNEFALRRAMKKARKP